MLFDPLLDAYTPPTVSPWLAIADAVNGTIERAAVKGNMAEAFKALNFMDLLDSECAAYWRERGLDLYGGRNGEETIQSASSGRLRVDELAYQPQEGNPLI